jgi:hypothetical protein
MSRTTTKLLKSYRADIEQAYKELSFKIKSLSEQNLEKMAFDKAVKSAAGRCGALCSAAIKRTCRDFVVAMLLEQKAKGLDVTPTVAQHACERLLGRGVDNRKTLEAFATPGRTAGDKSALGADDLVTIEARIKEGLMALGVEAGKIKEQCVAAYKAGTYK